MEENRYALSRPLPTNIGVITQWFGENPASYARFGLAGHNGLDYGAPLGSPILSAHAGTCQVGWDEYGYGCYVKISDGLFTTIYAHLQQALVANGQEVRQGQQIGVVGSTGNSTGPHLHFGVRVAGVRNPAYDGYVDPVIYRQINGDA